jgi:hypothetical protein
MQELLRGSWLFIGKLPSEFSMTFLFLMPFGTRTWKALTMSAFCIQTLFVFCSQSVLWGSLNGKEEESANRVDV